MEDKETYKNLLTDIIGKQVVILGPRIAILKARNVKGLTIGDDGTVTDIEGAPTEILQSLIDEYVNLAGSIVKATLGSVFIRYPTLKNPVGDSTVPSIQ